MRRTVIIGYGNPLRGDDGFGRCAARILREKLPSAEVQVIESHQLTPEIAEAVSRSEIAIFIDADRGSAPGQVNVVRLDSAVSDPASLTHHVSPGSLLSMAGILFGHRPEAFLLSAGGGSFGFEEGLSPEMNAALEKVVRCACDLARAGDNEISYSHK